MVSKATLSRGPRADVGYSGKSITVAELYTAHHEGGRLLHRILVMIWINTSIGIPRCGIER